MKSIDLQLLSSLLTAVNWRNIFADDRHVDDYVTSFLLVFNNAIQQSIFKSPVRSNKPKRILSKYIRQLILKNIVFGKRFTIKTALLTTGLRVENPNRRSAIMFLVKNKNYLNVIINLPSINTLTEHLAIVLYLSSHLIHLATLFALEEILLIYLIRNSQITSHQ